MLRWFTTSCKENLITTTVLRISKSITLAPPPKKKLTKEIKSKTRTRYEPETYRLLAYPQLTDLRWTVSHFVKIKTTNEKSVSFFICIKEVSYSPLMIKQ